MSTSTLFQNINVMFEDSNYIFAECNGYYQTFVSETARVFNLDPQLIYTGFIKIFYYDFVDWIRISSDEELAMSFVYKDPNTPIVLRNDDSMKNNNCNSIEVKNDFRGRKRKERKERIKGIKKRKYNNFENSTLDKKQTIEKEQLKTETNRGRKEKKGGHKRRKERVYNDNARDVKRAIEKEQRSNAVYVDETIFSLPENITHLFIDGNNLLYMTKTLRNYTLKRKINRAQEIINTATEIFASRMTGLKDVYVIFDNTSSTYEKILENGTNFFIKSARPDFSTADDMFVNWCEKNKNISPNSLHITSDRALCGRLNIEGAKVMKPKAFFNLTLKLTSQENENLDSWFSKVEENLVK